MCDKRLCLYSKKWDLAGVEGCRTIRMYTKDISGRKKKSVPKDIYISIYLLPRDQEYFEKGKKSFKPACSTCFRNSGLTYLADLAQEY
jgi:hypothetical protein